MKRKLILHIGTQKTGSTSLQHHCYKHLDQLSEQGIYYPDLGPWNPNHAILAFSGSNRRQFPDWLPGKYHNSDALKALVKSEFDKVCDLPMGTTTFVSFENFYTVLREGRNADFFRDFFAYYDFDVTILAYFRRPSDHVFSLYHQRLKMVLKPAPSFEEFCREKLDYYEYEANTEEIKRSLGVTTAVIRDYSNIGVDVVSDVFSLLNVHVAQGRKQETLNVKLSFEGFSMLQEFHRANLGKELSDLEVKKAIELREKAQNLAGTNWVKDMTVLLREYQQLDSDYADFMSRVATDSPLSILDRKCQNLE